MKRISLLVLVALAVSSESGWARYYTPFTTGIRYSPYAFGLKGSGLIPGSVHYNPYAFGTGHHETTKLCLRQVREDLKPGVKMLDLGTGSGVLSILAAKLGAVECFCVDNDPEAVQNAA